MLAEFYWLTLTVLMTALMWAPYILRFLFEKGVGPALMEGGGTTTPRAVWAARAKRAHANAVENLVVFAPLVLIAVMTQSTTQATATAAMVYFFARLVHYLIYLFGLPVLRTLSFVVGVLCQLVLAFSILGWV